MKSPAVAALAVVTSLAALALGAWTILGSETQSPPPMASTQLVQDRAPEVGAEATAALDGDGPSASTEDELEAPERREVEPAAPAGPAENPLRVRVLDAITGAAMPRAEVFWAALDGRSARDRLGEVPPLGRRFGSGSRHLAVGLIEAGQKRITDDLGETILPANPWRIAVAARVPGRIGFGEIERGKGDLLEIRLVDDAGVTVKVVDERGEPRSGAPVMISQGSRPDRSAAIWSTDTGADGLARMPYFKLFVRDGVGPRFVASLRVPLAVPAVQEFAGDPPPAEPIELRLPGTGRIEVTVLDRQGEPIESGLRLWTQVKRDPAVLGQLPLPPYFDIAMATKAHGQKSAVLMPVGLGLEFVVSARFEDAGRGERFNGPLFQGPLTDGETVKVQIVAPEWLALVRARMIGPKGEPWADAQVPSQVRDAVRVWNDREIQTDHEGRFELVLRIDAAVTLPAVMEMTEGMPDGTRLVGSVNLPGLAAGQRFELGDVQIREVPPFVQGRVVDELGQPIANARLQVQAAIDDKRFVDGGLARGSSDESGQFKLYGVPPAGALQLRATADRHIGEVVPILAAGTRVDVTLMRSVDLRLRIRLPDDVPDKAVRAELRSSDGKSRELDLRRRGNTATYAADDLPRGVFDLAVQVRNFPGDLRVIRGLVLEPDGDAEQRRIDIDLRDALFGYEVQVIGPGSVIDESVHGVVVARTIKPDGTLDWQAFQVAKGTAKFVAPLASLESVLIPQGRSEVRSWLQPGVNRLFSNPIFPVELTLPGMRALAGDTTIRISLVLKADTGLPQGIRGVDQHSGGSFGLERAMMAKSGGGWLGPDDHAQIPVTRNGRYQVVARVYSRTRGGNTSREIGEIDVVVDGSAPTNIVLPFDTKQFEEALQASKKRG